ncbi:MAG: hypothetical protein ACR2PZ_20205 [Pseudomonadales bacterium]
MITVIRWLLVPLSVALVAPATVALGQKVIGLADQRCAPEHLIGGACVESWHTGTVELVIYIGCLILAVGVTLLPASIAPAGKRLVASIGYLLLLGAFVTGYVFTRWPEFFTPAAVAAVAGALAVAWVFVRSRRDRSA